MSFVEPTSTPRPEETPEFVSARARRRQARRRAYFPSDETGRSELFTHLTRRAFPSYELFVFSLMAGAILGLGYLFNSQALLVFGILVAPLLTPWIGITLSIVAGALRLFAQTVIALLISCLLIFLCGWLAGYASRPFQPLILNEAFTHSRLWWPDLVALTIGAVLITVSFVRSEDRPYLPSVLLAYELFLPLSAAGFGLGSGLSEVWPAGLYVFFTHLAWGTFFGLLTLFILRFYPTSPGGFIFTGLILAALVGVVVYYTGLGSRVMRQLGFPSGGTPQTAIIEPTLQYPFTPGFTLSPQPDRATAVISSATAAPSLTPDEVFQGTAPASAETLTATVTAEPTPILAVIRAREGGGAFIRDQPGGQALITLANGSTVTIIPDDVQDLNGVTWVHVYAMIEDRRVEGWILQSLLQRP